MRRARLAVCALFVAAACSAAAPAAYRHAPDRPAAPSAVTTTAQAASSHVTKVLVIAEENHSYSQIIGSPQAPYINRTAQQYGLATNYNSGTPTSDQSMPSYFLMTAGTTFGVTRDCVPSGCSQSGDNVFHQADGAGGWRAYAESMPSDCYPKDTPLYVPRHAPAPFYTDVASQCRQWDVPLTALPGDLSRGLPGRYSFVAPNLVHDMHSASVAQGDQWLSTWLPKILAGADYRAGRLAVVVTWDEGSHTDNHVATIVISPSTQHLRVGTAYTHASLLRTCEEILGVPLLPGAATAPSMRSAFHLG